MQVVDELVAEALRSFRETALGVLRINHGSKEVNEVVREAVLNKNFCEALLKEAS